MTIKRKTGSGHALNPDNLATYYVVVGLLALSVLAAGVGSVDGLLHAGAWAMPEALQWVVPVAVDVFLVATALGTLMLRKRGAYFAAIGVAVVTLALVAFSSTVNWLYVFESTEVGTPAHLYGPWLKGAMPILLLAATEIVAALTSTRNNRENSPLNRAKRDVKRYKAEGASLRKQLRSRAVPVAIESDVTA
jgi:hypothetical protein